MPRHNIHGGGARTNFNGLSFEGRTNFLKAIENDKNFEIKKKIFLFEIFYKSKKIGFYTEKHNFYKFLESKQIDWKKLVSKKYLPDGVFINIPKKKIFIIEKKFQEGGGSVDEKLQTCDFKRKIYKKLLKKLNYFQEVEYFYLLNNWFKREEYTDVKKYIVDVGCRYFIDKIGLKDLDII